MLITWATWPLIERQTQIMRGWGVPVTTGGVWAKRTVNGKLRWGTGFVLRSLCEPFLIGRLPGGKFAKGKVPNLLETLADAALDGLAREHSRKPDEFYFAGRDARSALGAARTSSPPGAPRLGRLRQRAPQVSGRCRIGAADRMGRLAPAFARMGIPA